MKTIFAACFIGLLPAMAVAQTYTPPDDTNKPKPFQPVLAEQHTGLGRIGVRLVFDKVTGLPVIAGLTKGGPAVDYGFRVGDIIIKIDKNLTSSLSEDEIHLALRGQPGTGVELTIQRDDDPKYIVRAVERRILPEDAEEMVNPPMSEVAKNGPVGTNSD
ncbi:MAG TPA: PDZ domain-containing protein [Candidatus Methylacidiphilales bacterium]|nr:PDZ domain-containing protein [Candidatus Methylacidiphilales bacterium]